MVKTKRRPCVNMRTRTQKDGDDFNISFRLFAGKLQQPRKYGKYRGVEIIACIEDFAYKTTLGTTHCYSDICKEHFNKACQNVM